MKLNILSKLLANAGLLLAFVAVVGALGVVGLSSVDGHARSSYTTATRPLADLGAAEAAFIDNKSLVREVVLERSPRTMSRLLAKMNANSAIVNAKLAAAEPTLTTPAEKRALASIRADQASYRAARSRVLALARADRDAQAFAVLKARMTPKATTIQRAYETLFDLKVRLAVAKNAQVTSVYRSQRTLAIVLIAVALVLGLGISFLIARGIVKGVRRMLEAAERIGDGDLTVDVSDVRSGDEIGDMAAAFQRMGEKLR
jgi:methyl-accepting chemotaxis protein